MQYDMKRSVNRISFSSQIILTIAATERGLLVHVIRQWNLQTTDGVRTKNGTN